MSVNKFVTGFTGGALAYIMLRMLEKEKPVEIAFSHEVYLTDVNGRATIPHPCDRIISFFPENAFIYVSCLGSYTKVQAFDITQQEEVWKERDGELHHIHTFKPVKTKIHIWVIQ